VISKEHEKAGDRVRREIREMGEKEDKLMREREWKRRRAQKRMK
jgi:hypothetical protein